MSNSLKIIITLWYALVGIILLSVAENVLSDETRQVIPIIPIGLIEPDIPRDKPLTLAKVALGKKIFFDIRLSYSSKMSCATCHNPAHGFAEPRSISFNARGDRLRRNAPSVLNAGYLTTVSWDGRFKTLEDHVTEPFSKNGDMGIEIDEAIDRIDNLKDYIGMFEIAFGRTADRSGLVEALAAYQRTLISGNSRFDDFLFKGNQEALTAREKLGYEIFIGKASCINCHDIFHPSVNSLGGGVALFSDFRFHNLGVGYANGKMSDAGRYYATRDKAHWGAFKTPMLRNVALTPPYMHDGSLEKLRDVIDFYDRGGNPNPNIAPGIKPLLLTNEEKESVVAFLESLTDKKLISAANDDAQIEP